MRHQQRTRIMNKQLQDFETLYLPQVNTFLKTHLKTAANQSLLGQAMTYSVEAGGKRLRPLLTLATIVSLGETISPAALQAATAVELLHTYSLIHDDLPAMDNDDLRRGQKTNHKVFGEDIAILAGDGLQALAFDWLSTSSLSSDIVVKLIQQLAEAAGPRGMVAGQVEDVSTTGTVIPLAQLQALHKRKTGALLEYAVQAGATIAGASQTQDVQFRRFGAAFGLAFQIYDDILDETATAAELGKTPHKDVAEGKNTYPRLIGLTAARKALSDSLNNAQAACDALAKLDVDSNVLRAFLS